MSLGAHAGNISSNPKLLPKATLLAVESMLRCPSSNAAKVLRRALVALPHPLGQFSHLSAVRALAASAKGNLLATGSDDGVVRLWGAHTLMPRGDMGSECRVNALSFDPDERWIASASEEPTVRVWELKERRFLLSLMHHEPVRRLQVSSD